MAGLHQAMSGVDQMEQMAMGISWIHKRNPMCKMLVTILYLFLVISFPLQNVSGLIPFLCYPILLISVSEIPYGPLFKRLWIALPFAFLAGISNVWLESQTAFYFGSVAISYGAIFFVSILLKTIMTVFGMLILTATTPYAEIGNTLVCLRVPQIICLQLMMMYRYLSVLIGEASVMHTAYGLRAAGQKGIKIRDMGSFLGQLLLRSFDKAERIYQAMKCRGFSGVFYGRKSAWNRTDVAYLIGVMVIMIFLRVFNLSIFLGNLM